MRNHWTNFAEHWGDTPWSFNCQNRTTNPGVIHFVGIQIQLFCAPKVMKMNAPCPCDLMGLGTVRGLPKVQSDSTGSSLFVGHGVVRWSMLPSFSGDKGITNGGARVTSCADFIGKILGGKHWEWVSEREREREREANPNTDQQERFLPFAPLYVMITPFEISTYQRVFCSRVLSVLVQLASN